MGRGSRTYLDHFALQGSNRVQPSLSYTNLTSDFRPRTLRVIFFRICPQKLWNFQILWNMAKVEFSPERVQKTHTIAFQCARVKTKKHKKHKFHLYLCFSVRYVNLASMCGKFLGLWWGPARYSKEKANAYHDGIAFQNVRKCLNEWRLFGPKAHWFYFSQYIHGTPSQRCFHTRCPGFLAFCTGHFFGWWNTDVGFSLHVPFWMWLFTSSFYM